MREEDEKKNNFANEIVFLLGQKPVQYSVGTAHIFAIQILILTLFPFFFSQGCRCSCSRSNFNGKMLCTQNTASTFALSNVASDNRARNIDTTNATESITSGSRRYVYIRIYPLFGRPLLFSCPSRSLCAPTNFLFIHEVIHFANTS